MTGETNDQLHRLRVFEDVSRTVGSSVLEEEFRLGRAEPGDADARRHTRLAARVMLDSLVAKGVEIPTELLADDEFQTEVIPGVARNTSIRPSADQIDAQIDQVLAEEAEEEAVGSQSTADPGRPYAAPMAAVRHGAPIIKR